MVKLDLIFYDLFPFSFVHRVALMRDMVLNKSFARFVLSWRLFFDVNMRTRPHGSENFIVLDDFDLFLWLKSFMVLPRLTLKMRWS